MTTFKKTIEAIKGDLPEKGLKSFVKNYFLNPGFRVLLNYRIGKYFFSSQFFLLRQIGNYYRKNLIIKRGCDISYYAKIGRGVVFPHAMGIVIGEGVVIGNRVKIWQQVTFGSHGKENEELKYPVIADNVKVFAGAKIIGGVKIEANAIIGANAVVNIDVPVKSIAVGIPCKILSGK